ncbi:MAG: type II toxin-antitoxin system prevent-host-death family antitoxin [Kiritimatiellae bacterium]|nr:type II toxin-antitoxin system prevent-host-death family antitoxin [Kiritimatiellia bacterium]
MKMANVAEIKAHFSEFLALVQAGEEVQICKRNRPVARMIAEPGLACENRTQLGCGRKSVKVMCDLTEPAIPSRDWDMLGEGQ